MLGRLYRWIPWPSGPHLPVPYVPANDNQALDNATDAPRKGADGFLTVPSLASATRDYARALEAGRFDRLDPIDRTRLFMAMGADIWAWQYARRLTDQPPWRAGPGVDERHERSRAMHQMDADVTTWERAMLAREVEAERARRFDLPMPAPLLVPYGIQCHILARRKVAAERTTRKRGRDDAGGEPAPRPDEVVAHPPFPSKPR